MSNRLWISAAGLLTAVLVAHLFSPELQGYYYTFTSLMLAQTLFDMGFNQVLTHFFSHEVPRQSQPNSSRVRMHGLLRFGLKMNGIAALGFFVAVGFAGQWLLSQHSHESFPVLCPWWIMVAAASGSICLGTLRAYMEGTQQIELLQKFQLVAGVSSYLVGWGVMWSGGKLFTLSVVLSLMAVSQSILLIRHNWGILQGVFGDPNANELDFIKEFWQQSWRIAVSWVSGFFAAQTFVPILFYFQGPILAGQMGMTLQIYTVCNLFSSIWLYTQAPRFGVLAAQMDYAEVMRLVAQTQRRGVFTACAISGVLLVFVHVLHHYFNFQRILSLADVSIMLATVCIVQYSTPPTSATRFLKIEPFMKMSICSALGVMACSLLAARYGQVMWMCLGFLFFWGVLGAIVGQTVYRRIFTQFLNTASQNKGFNSHESLTI